MEEEDDRILSILASNQDPVGNTANLNLFERCDGFRTDSTSLGLDLWGVCVPESRKAHSEETEMSDELGSFASAIA